MSEQREDLSQAEELGRLKAERLDAALRTAERRERELCLARLVWDSAGPLAPVVDSLGGLSGARNDGWEGASAAEMYRLRQDVERLAAFHQAVLRSRAWRLVQSLRRPLGRAW
jgi:hypothetical protein